MTFTYPLALLLLPFTVWGFWRLSSWLRQRQRANAFTYTSLAFASSVFGRNVLLERCLLLLPLLAVAVATFALAGPSVTLRLPQHDGSVVVCIDTSGSMATRDISPTRASAAVQAAHLFVHHLPQGVRVGVVSFASNANVLLTPEPEPNVVDQALERIPAPNGATAIGDALVLAEQMLPARGRRAIVLLTDGVNNRGSDPSEAAQELATHHIVLYTVGIGTSQSGQLIPGTDEAADADPDALRGYAETTGGAFVAVSDAAQIANAFLQLARETTWEAQSIKLAMPAMVFSALALLLTWILALAFGRVPL